MRWLITGADGCLGQALVSRLLAEGHQLVLVVRGQGGPSWQVAAGRSPSDVVVHACSLGDPNRLADVTSGCDVVVHAAAVHCAGSGARALRWVNVAGTENVLNASVRAGVSRFVHVSCSDVTLVDRDRFGFDETHDVAAPLSLHGKTKRLGEELVASRDGDGITTVILRPARIWGPGERTWLPQLLSEVRNSGAIRIPGKGDNLIAALYVEHAVDAVLAAAHATGIGGRAYYVTDNQFVGVRDFFSVLSERFGMPPPRCGGSYRLGQWRLRVGGGLARGLPDRETWIQRGRSTLLTVQRAIEELGYAPAVPWEDGMRHWAEWVNSEGGTAALCARARRPESDAAVDDMVRLAGGDEAAG